MTSLNVASATSSRQPTPVLSREKLPLSGIVSIYVPQEARLGEVENGIKVTFLHFFQGFKGGIINMFVHADGLENLRGREITAEFEIWRKTMADGRAYLYVDLRPTDAEPTHRMAILKKEDAERNWPDDHTVIPTPAPLSGAIVLAPPGAKIPTSKSMAPYPTFVKKPVKAGGGDAQLNRLLADGWTISAEDAAHVYLAKNDRTLTHHKPSKRK